MRKATFIQDKVWPFDFKEYDYVKDIRPWDSAAPLNAPALSDSYNTSVSPTPFHGNVRVSIDFDGTITAYPELFARLVHKIRKGGGKIYILTGRSLLDKDYVTDYLIEHNIEFDDIITFPVEYTDLENDSIVEMLLGQYKSQKIKDLHIDIHIDDSDIQIKQIRNKHPEMLVLKPWFDKQSNLVFKAIKGANTWS